MMPPLPLRVVVILLLAEVMSCVASASPAIVTAAAHADAQKLAARDLATGSDDARFHRYLWRSDDPKFADDFFDALRYHVHATSDQAVYGKWTYPVPALIRVDLRDYGWDKRLPVWEQAVKIDPYFHARIEYLEDTTETIYWPGGVDPRDGKHYDRGGWPTLFKAGAKSFTAAPSLPKTAIDGLRKILVTEAPILDAEWFLAQTSRQLSYSGELTGFGYYDILGLKTRQDYFDLIGVDEKANARNYAQLRAAVIRSGVAKFNRLVGRNGASAGGEWFTLDTAIQKGRGVLKNNLRPGEFKHVAEERYGPNPLGLPVTIACDDKGVLQNTVPSTIAGDKSKLNVGNDTDIHPNLCIRCHGIGKSDMLMSLDDWSRKSFKPEEGPLLDKDKKALLELQALFLRDIKTKLEADRKSYAIAVATVTKSDRNPNGLTSAALTKIYCEAINRYVEDDVNLASAARKLGVPSATLLAKLKAYQATKGRSELVVLDLLKPGGTMPRLDFEESYQFLATIAAGLAPAELPRKRKEVKP